MRNTILGAEMEESKWTRLKNIVEAMKCGVISIVIGSLIIGFFEDGWKYLVGGFFIWMGGVFLKEDIFGKKEVSELAEDKPPSKEREYLDVERIRKMVNECKAKAKEKIEINKQEKWNKSNPDMPMPPNVVASQNILKKPEAKPATEGKTYNISDRIGKRYEIYRILGGEGKSGMGVVYVCYDHKFKEVFALKTFQDKYLSSKEMKDNFKKEALTWIHLDYHPHIVRAILVEKLDYHMFVICEFIAPDDEGKNTLSHYLRSPVSLKQALTWSIQFCYGMEHAYSKGVSPHRDIKPDNIMITSDKTLKITDFGLSGLWEGAVVPEDLIKEERKGFTFLKVDGEKVVAGTPPYMAPEQFNGIADVRSDIYSFGIVMYQMIDNGRLPFYPKAGEDWEAAHKGYSALLQQTKGRADSRLFPIIDRCLRKKPEERYAKFEELRKALEELYREITGENPPPPPEKSKLEAWELFNKGLSLANLGLFDEAIKEYREAIRIKPDFAGAHNNLGIALISSKGLLDEAIKEFKEAIRINPEYAEAHNNLGMALNFTGETEVKDEAIKEFKEAIRINPEYAEAHNNLGIALRDKGLLDEAIKEFKEAIRIKPDYTTAYNNLEITINGKVFLDEAIKEYKKTIRFNENEMIYHYIFDIDLRVKTWEEAIKKCKEAISINPKDAKAHYKLGKAFRYKGLLDEAIKEYKEAIRITPEYADAHYELGIVLHGKGLLDEAIKEYRETIRIAGYVNGHFSLGNALRDKGLLDEAIKEYREAIKNYEHAEVHNNLGSVLRDKGLLDEAIVAFESFIRYAPPHYAGFVEITKGIIKQMKGRIKEKC